MDRCIWINFEDDFFTEASDKIFMGDETCGKILASSEFLKRVVTLMESGLNVSIVTPYLMPETESDFIGLLRMLPERTNIVVNDVGALQIVKKSNHIPIIGRLLMRQNTDPAIMSFFMDHPNVIVREWNGYAILEHVLPSKSMMDHLKNSTVFSNETSRIFLSGHKKMMVMMDMLPQGLPNKIPERFSVVLNTDNILVSVLPCNSCDHCPKHEIILGTTRANVPIYRKKNVCYYKLSDIPNRLQYAIPSYVSSVIYSIKS